MKSIAAAVARSSRRQSGLFLDDCPCTLRHNCCARAGRPAESQSYLASPFKAHLLPLVGPPFSPSLHSGSAFARARCGRVRVRGRVLVRKSVSNVMQADAAVVLLCPARRHAQCPDLD